MRYLKAPPPKEIRRSHSALLLHNHVVFSSLRTQCHTRRPAGKSASLRQHIGRDLREQGCRAHGLKDSGIAVVAVNPGMVATEFGPGMAGMTSMGGVSVAQSCAGLLKVFETTGRFMNIPMMDGSAPCEYHGGW